MAKKRVDKAAASAPGGGFVASALQVVRCACCNKMNILLYDAEGVVRAGAQMDDLTEAQFIADVLSVGGVPHH